MSDIVRRNPKAFVIAVLAHVLLFVVLSLKLDWTQTLHIAPPQQEIVQAVMVDDAKLKVEQEKRRKADEKRRQEEEARLQREEELKRKEELKREQEAEQRRVEEVERQQREVEERRALEVRQKREAEERRVAEVKRQQAESEKQRKVEEEKQRKAEAEKKHRAEERKRQEAEEQRLREEQMRQEEQAAEEQQKQAARQRELDSEKNRYLFMIQQRVDSKWIKPSVWQRGMSCKVRVRLVPGAGVAQVIDVRIIKSSGQPLFDRSVESAVFSASPLPFPTSPELMSEFREITFDFKPED